MTRARRNDAERAEWIANDEGLAAWHAASKLPLRAFIRANRTEIDRAIDLMVGGKRRAHFLMYG